MNELKELFKKRDELVTQLGEEIFNSIPNVVDGCKKFVVEKGADPELLKWDDVHFLEDNEIVLLIGSITYKPGDTVTLPNGEKLEISENTAQYFQAMLRLGIPYNLATTGSVDEIYNFLKETIEVDDDTEVVNEAVVNDNTGFDMNELTEEQKKAMELFTPSGSKN